ncbi:MAG TPA: hypothetical protein PKO06_08255, partial [Candidatus Ozemobacteraceae bacterium]|nr:hypothetical protein [Candidatus Ozemobacteraceae bacterium]
MIPVTTVRVSLLMLLCCLLSSLVLPLPAAAANRADLWKKVEKAINEGLPKTAIEHLTPIVDAALQDKAYGEAARAMCRKIVLEANIQGNKAEEKVTRLQTTLETAPGELKPLLRAVLARWYWHFFRQNNWRFMNRTATAKLDEKDFTTWDLPKLFGHIGGLFDAAIADKASLQALSIKEFNEFLSSGNMPAEYRPTLYDFLVYQALEFYTSGEQAGAYPQDAFFVEADSPALADASAFMAWNPATTDTDSPKLKAIRLLQDLLKFHAKDKDRGAFLDADIYRLRWLKSVAVGENAAEACFKQLEVIAREFADHQLSSTAFEAMAQIRFAEGNRKEAHQLASEGSKRFPNSAGGHNCRSLISQIEQKLSDPEFYKTGG